MTGKRNFVRSSQGGPANDGDVSGVAAWTTFQPAEYSPASMWAGDVLAERFLLERQIGGGGMGTVFRALDRATGTPVAVKAIDVVSEGAVERFRREARVLSDMSHPGIVRYIAHGESEEGEPFLVMEWLEGEDLSRSLARGGLSVEASLTMVRRAAEALAFAHSQGVVHRDIKPSNLFLVGCDSERVKVLDFGIAKPRSPSRELTGASTLLGTFGYMAPEQVTGSALVDARADVFSLGCVLFECLTGRPAFAAEHAVAVLAKLLAADVPKPSSLRPELGSAVDELLARMLAKEPDARLKDAHAVVEAIAEVGAVGEARAPTVDRQGARITDSERTNITVILAEHCSAELARTMTPTETGADLGRIQELATQFGAEAQPLPGAAFLVVLSGRTTPTDQAMHAASLALALSRALSETRIALATGQTETSGRVPVGPVIDRAATLLKLLDGGGGAAHPRIAVDSVTAGLLEPRFILNTHEHVQILEGERSAFDTPRYLLGKPTPCVGRDKELGSLELTLREVLNDSVARAVLVTAPAGMGKSRLLTEFVKRMHSFEGLCVLVARADSIAPGSPLALIRQIIRRAAGLVDSDPVATQRERFQAYLSVLAQSRPAETAFEFICELAGLPQEGTATPLLAAARNDPAVMREQKRRAFDWWIDAQLAVSALLIVLEDLHWGDPGAVNYLDRALLQHTGRQLMVLASARPELHEIFSKLFPEAQEINLTGLAPRAAERLVRATLDTGVTDDAVARIVQRADGNPFYLEELIRRAAEGDESLPETVIAMVQSRLSRLEPEARRVLRVASVFGDACWAGGVSAVAGSQVDAVGWLEALSDRELLVRRGESRFPGDREFAFRHNLFREAAYAMLTDDDRAAVHRTAGDWLERVGEADAGILADHFERGGEKARALRWIVPAALAALLAGSLRKALDISGRGLDLGATGGDRGALLMFRAYAVGWKADYALSRDLAREAIAFCPTGTLLWWQAVGWLCVTAPADAAQYAPLALTMTPVAPSGSYGAALYGLLSPLCIIGQVELARSFIEQLNESVIVAEPIDLHFDGWRNAIRCQLAQTMPYRGEWRLENALRWGEESVIAMATVGSIDGELGALMMLGFARLAVGAYDEAKTAFSRLVERARPTEIVFLSHYGEVGLALVEARDGCLANALQILVQFHDSRIPHLARFSRVASAAVQNGAGNFDAALRLAESALDGAEPATRRWAFANAAYALFSLARFDDALRSTDRALAESALVNFDIEGGLLAVRAATFRALDRNDEARSTIREARDLVLSIADGFENPELRKSFLTNLPFNQSILLLANDWLGEEQT